MDIFNPQIVDREPTEKLGTVMDVGAELYTYVQAYGDIRKHMPVTIETGAVARETENLAPNMAVAGYAIPDGHFGWVLTKGNTRVDPRAKARLDAQSRIQGNRARIPPEKLGGRKAH